ASSRMGIGCPGRNTLRAWAWGKERPSSVTVARNRWRTRDIDSSTSSSQIACATGVAVSAFTVIAAPILEPFNGKGRIPHATVGDKIGGGTWTNAKHSGERSSLARARIVAWPGD